MYDNLDAWDIVRAKLWRYTEDRTSVCPECYQVKPKRYLDYIIVSQEMYLELQKELGCSTKGFTALTCMGVPILSSSSTLVIEDKQ